MISKIQISHWSRCFMQYARAQDLAIVGCYHFGNLGDMALGQAVAEQCKRSNISCGMQTIYNLEKWKKFKFGVVGGGAVTQKENLLQLFDRFDPENLAFCGVDIEDWDAFHSLESQLSKVRFFSVRSREQADTARKKLGKDFVIYHPDIAFSLRALVPIQEKIDRTALQRVILNICPRFHNSKQETFCRDKALRKSIPNKLLRDNLSYFYRSLASRCIDQGLEVEHVSFTPSDHKVAEQVLDGLPVKKHPYCPDPRWVLALLKRPSIWIPSRYHSLIFALIGMNPVLPVAYADKTVRLLADLEIDPGVYIDLNTLASRQKLDQILQSGLPSVPLLNGQQVDRLSEQATQGIGSALTSIGLPRAS